MLTPASISQIFLIVYTIISRWLNCCDKGGYRSRMFGSIRTVYSIVSGYSDPLDSIYYTIRMFGSVRIKGGIISGRFGYSDLFGPSDSDLSGYVGISVYAGIHDRVHNQVLMSTCIYGYA